MVATDRTGQGRPHARRRRTIAAWALGTLVALVAATVPAPGASAEPTPGATTSAIAAPTAVSVQGLNARAWVSWTAPAGSGITGYQITPVADGVDLPATTIASQATKGYVRDLPNGVALRFAVAAIDAGGVGPRSALSGPVILPFGSFSATVNALYVLFAGRGPTNAERAAGMDLLAADGHLGGLVQELRRGSAAAEASTVDAVTRLYFAYLLRVPDFGGLDYWIRKKRAGTSLYAISQSFAQSSEFVRRYGSLSNRGFVELVYDNVMERRPDSGGLSYWTRELDLQRKTRGHVMASFSQSSEYQRRMATRVDVTVIWELVARRTVPTAAYERWLGDHADAHDPLGDLAAEALGTTEGSDRWHCLAQPPRTAADQHKLLNHRDDRWRIADNARSVALPDGRIMWIFADTLYGKVNADGTLPSTGGWGYTHGSALIQDGACIDPFYKAGTTAPSSLIPDVSSTHFFWPQSAWVDSTGKTLWMVAGRRLGTPNSGGTHGGTVIAKFSLPDLVFQGTSEMPDPPKGKGIHWSLPLKVGDWVYVYADSGGDPDASWPFDHHAARFPAAGSSFLNGTGWQYWNGTGWSSSVANLRPMTFPNGKLITSNVMKTASGYALVAKPYGETSVLAWKSTSPAGPWTLVGTVANLNVTPVNRAYSVHGESTVPGVGPLVVWSQSSGISRNITGAQVGVASPSLPVE